jgi:type IV pilus assembly protein PilV
MRRLSSWQMTQKSAGFTLTEVLIAVVVLSVGFLGLSAMTIAVTKSLSFSNKLTTATTLAQEKVEEIKRANYTNVTSANYPPEASIPGYPLFSRSVAISVDNPMVNTKTVTITTSWKRDAVSSPYTVELKTIINQ